VLLAVVLHLVGHEGVVHGLTDGVAGQVVVDERDLLVLPLGGVGVVGLAELAQVRLRLRVQGPLPRLADRGQEDPDEQGDDRDDHEQLDDREPREALTCHFLIVPFQAVTWPVAPLSGLARGRAGVVLRYR
jgi:hypothetical protein